MLSYQFRTVPVLASAALCCALLMTSAGMAAASTLVVDRGLPTDNLNNAAGGDRSNVAWGNPGFLAPGDVAFGDSFSLAASAPAWEVNKLRTWIVAGDPDDTNFQLGSRYNSLSLYLGPSGELGDTIDRVATSTITVNTADSASLTITPVTYEDGSHYQGTDGSDIQIWQIDFDLAVLLAPGDYWFGVGADQVATDLEDATPLFLHASNAALGGVPADDADDRYLDFDVIGGGTQLQLFAVNDSNVLGWDKSSDINVQIFATAIPLPGALPLMAGGLGLLGLMGWRQRRAV